MEEETLTGNAIKLTHGETYYEFFGPDDGELVVCLHGITFWSFCFHKIEPFLTEKHYRLLLFDFYGRGSSDSPKLLYNLPLYVQQTVELLNVLNIEGKVNLLGFSMGGAVACTFAAKYPDRVKKLILIAPAVTPVPIPFAAKLITYPGAGALFAIFGRKAMQQKLRNERLKDDFYDIENAASVIEEVIQKVEWLLEYKDGFLHAFHSTLCHVPLTTGILDTLRLIHQTIPIYILWPENDTTVPLSSSKSLPKILPHAKLEVLHKCGHACILEKPEESANYILNFLRETPTALPAKL